MLIWFGLVVVEEGERAGDEGFTERFGWIYNAKQVADFEGISLWECFEKDTLSFLNHLVYLKEYGEYQLKLNKNAGNSEW